MMFTYLKSMQNQVYVILKLGIMTMSEKKNIINNSRQWNQQQNQRTSVFIQRSHTFIVCVLCIGHNMHHVSCIIICYFCCTCDLMYVYSLQYTIFNVRHSMSIFTFITNICIKSSHLVHLSHIRIMSIGFLIISTFVLRISTFVLGLLFKKRQIMLCVGTLSMCVATMSLYITALYWNRHHSIFSTFTMNIENVRILFSNFISKYLYNI